MVHHPLHNFVQKWGVGAYMVMGAYKVLYSNMMMMMTMMIIKIMMVIIMIIVKMMMMNVFLGVFPRETCSTALNKCKYKNTKHIIFIHWFICLFVFFTCLFMGHMNDKRTCVMNRFWPAGSLVLPGKSCYV